MGIRDDFNPDDVYDAVEADIELQRFDNSLLGDVDEADEDETGPRLGHYRFGEDY